MCNFGLFVIHESSFFNKCSGRGPMLKETTKITTLGNGIRVISEDFGGFSTTVGVYTQVGSRHEPIRGLSQIRSRLALNPTQKRFNGVRVIRDIAETACLSNSAI